MIRQQSRHQRPAQVEQGIKLTTPRAPECAASNLPVAGTRLLTGAVGGERPQTATVIVDDGNQAASSPDPLSSRDP